MNAVFSLFRLERGGRIQSPGRDTEREEWESQPSCREERNGRDDIPRIGHAERRSRMRKGRDGHSVRARHIAS